MLNKDELRKFSIHNAGVSGTAFDDYVHHVESMTRAVIEERPTNFREIDVFSRLIMDRIIFLGVGSFDPVPEGFQSLKSRSCNEVLTRKSCVAKRSSSSSGGELPSIASNARKLLRLMMQTPPIASVYLRMSDRRSWRS